MLRFTRATNASIYGWSIAVSSLVMLSSDKLVGVVFALWLWSSPLILWRHGVTVDTARKKIRAWRGPMFGLFSKDYDLSDYAIVSVMEDSVETFQKNSHFKRTYSSSLGLKLQPRLRFDTHFADELPPVLTLRTYSASKKAREKAKREGEELAQRLGLEFRSDI